MTALMLVTDKGKLFKNIKLLLALMAQWCRDWYFPPNPRQKKINLRELKQKQKTKDWPPHQWSWSEVDRKVSCCPGKHSGCCEHTWSDSLTCSRCDNSRPWHRASHRRHSADTNVPQHRLLRNL